MKYEYHVWHTLTAPERADHGRCAYEQVDLRELWYSDKMATDSVGWLPLLLPGLRGRRTLYV